MKRCVWIAVGLLSASVVFGEKRLWRVGLFLSGFLKMGWR